MYKIPYVLGFCLLLANTFFTVAQTDDSISLDSLSNASPLDSTGSSAEPAPAVRKDIQTTINYFAKDSIRFDVIHQKVYLYGGKREADSLGGSHVDYGDITMDAGIIVIDWANSTLTATYSLDSNGKKVGVPLLIEGGDPYMADSMIYNYSTGQAYISEMLTPQAEGWLRGPQIYKDPDDMLYIVDGKFCPCEDPDAGTYIKSSKIKVITKKPATKTEPARTGKVISGPFLLHIADIPTPIGLPFGVFPTSSEKSSGIIIPSYGEVDGRGFYLRNGGFYWAMNDYIGMKFLGEIYSNGGWGTSLYTNYKLRYRFDGNFNLVYRKVVQNGDEFSKTVQNNYQFRWRHTPVSRGGKTFSADVNVATSTFLQNTATTQENFLTATLRSNVRYSTPLFKKRFNMSVNLRHNQNNQTGIANFSLPEFNLSMNRVYPFKSKTPKPGRKKTKFRSFYESINVGYSLVAQNQLTNEVSLPSFPFELSNGFEDTVYSLEPQNFGVIFENGRLGARHTVPISGTMKFGPFNLNGSFNYNDFWYPRSINYIQDSINYVTLDTGGVTRAFGYSTGANVTTRIYGYYKLLGERDRQIRHILNPRIGFTYTPDYTSEGPWGDRYQTIQTTDSTSVTISRFNGFLYSPPTAAKSSRLTFGFSNIVEMKVAPKDSGDYKYLKLLENLSASSSWNFQADSLNMAVWSLSANTNLFNRINIRADGRLDPYLSDTIDGRTIRTNRFAVTESGNGIGRMTSYGFALSTSLNPNAFTKYFDGNTFTNELQSYLNAHPEQRYIDFEIPWDFRVSYNLRVTNPAFSDRSVTQSLQLNGNLNLTRKWKISYRAAYDFTNKAITSPQLGVHRDLGCWVATMSYVPFGQLTSYEFYINIKSAMLSDVLKFQRRNSNYDRF